MNNDLQVVGFRIGRESFGVDISAVHEIVRVPDITAVPEAPEYVEGVINLRGKIISVVDLRKRFGQPEIKASKKNRVIVVEHESKPVGLIVDAASEVMRLPAEQIEPTPSVFEDAGLSYVTGLGKLKDRLIILVDLKKVLQKGELRLPDMQMAAPTSI